MPPKKTKTVIVLVANVGSSSLDQNSIEEEPFLDKTKNAMKLLVEKKIFLQPKDEIGIITMGDNESNNPEDIDNVKLYSEHLMIPNWEMVKYINNLKSTNFSCNWIEALNSAIQLLLREQVSPTSEKFIVIFNNFKEDAEIMNEYNIDAITKDLQRHPNLHFLFIGENPLNKDNVSESFVMSMIKKNGAQYENMKDFIEGRQFFMAPPANAIPWNVSLDWAGLEIPCSVFVKVNEGAQLNPWKKEVKNSAEDFGDGIGQSSNVVKENVLMDSHRNEISEDDIIYGYKFGGKYIPVSEEDEMAMRYSSEKKGLKIYGFIPQDKIKLEYWSGKGSRIVVPQSDDYAEMFYSLVTAMVEKKMVAVVRKVWQQNSVPTMGVLFPKVKDNDIWCLVLIELPYCEEIRVPQKGLFKSETDLEGEQEKMKAVENFIESMTIEDELSYLEPGFFPNVVNQYNWNALADRAVNPNNPILPVNNYIKMYLEPAEILKTKCKPHVEELDKLFGNSTESNDLKVEAPVISRDVTVVKKGDFIDSSIFVPKDMDLKMEELEDL